MSLHYKEQTVAFV